MNKLFTQAKLFVNRNSATILTCVGGAGVVATAVMAAKATPKALHLLKKAEEEKGEELTKLEKVRYAGPAYIPSIITGAATIACIFGANALNKRQQAALMSAYALLDSKYKDYRNKVDELYGENADDKVQQELAKDNYNNVKTQEDKILFYDEFTGKYFESTNEKVIAAQYAINRKIALNGAVCLNEWLYELDVEPVDYGGYLGWSSSLLMDCQWTDWLDFEHYKIEIDDDLECIAIRTSLEPMYDYEYY